MDSFKKITILLVDDDETDIMVIKRSFKKAGIKNDIVTANGGLEALEWMRGDGLGKTYLVLLDLNMPHMDGHSCLDEIRKDPTIKDAVVFVLTSSDSEDDRLRASQNNVAGYLLKEFAGEDIKNVSQVLQSYWDTLNTTK